MEGESIGSERGRGIGPLSMVTQVCTIHCRFIVGLFTCMFIVYLCCLLLFTRSYSNEDGVYTMSYVSDMVYHLFSLVYTETLKWFGNRFTCKWSKAVWKLI